MLWIILVSAFPALKGTIDIGLLYMESSEVLTVFVDDNWLDNEKWCTGYASMLGGGPVSWESKKHGTVALSSTEEEWSNKGGCQKYKLLKK